MEKKYKRKGKEVKKNPLDQRGSQSPEQFTDPLQEKQSSGNMGFILVNVYNKSKGMRNENIFQKRVDDIFDSVKKVTCFDDEILLQILDLQYDFQNEEDFQYGNTCTGMNSFMGE